jgi:MFS family permease
MNDTTPRILPRAKWTTFCYLATWGYLLYGLGNATPYLRDDLRLSAFEAGLHASALALGILVAGVTADIVGRRVGPSRLLDLSVVYFAVAAALIIVAPALPVSLCGAFLLGLGGGTLTTQVNLQLSGFGRAQGRILLSQANAVAVIAAAVAPIAISLAASVLHAWRLAMLAPIVWVAVLTALRQREGGTSTVEHAPKATLPRSYWIVWLLLVLGVAIEFSFVYWGSTVVILRTGISTADATMLASLFVMGMFAVRVVIGSGVASGRSPLTLLAVGLVAAIAGATLTWISATPILSGLGLFLGGCGVSVQWPVGVTVAMHTAGEGQLQAAARATLGSGLAILIAPAMLGLAGDAFGVAAAWPIIIGFAVCSLGVVAVAHRVGAEAVSAG